MSDDQKAGKLVATGGKRYVAWLLAVLGLVLLVFVGCLLMLNVNEQRLQEEKPIEREFNVPKGASQKGVFQALEQAKLIDCAVCLEMHARIFSLEGSIKAGTYEFSGNYSALDVVSTLIEGKIAEFKVTLIEGKTLDDWLNTLWAHPRIIKTLSGDTRDQRYESVREALDLEVYPEGLFLPDTYAFAADTPEVAILRRAYRLQTAYMDKIWQDKQANLPIKTQYEALILASIVEKETGDPAERPIIAGVFMNRLNKKMRLETDPTVIYGIKEYDGNITRAHLRTPTPYNTYTIKGLPPTPIAASSRAAMDAVLKPQSTKAIFFVAKGDGSHVFSQTLQQHNTAVRAYQLKRRENYRSAPQVQTAKPQDKSNEGSNKGESSESK